MSRYASLPTLALFAALVLAAPLGAQKTDDRKEGTFKTYTRAYPIHHLDLHEAEILAWDQCSPGAGDRCLVIKASVTETGSSIEVLADAVTHERIARKLLEADAVPRTQTFQIILLVADQGTGGEGDLPANAAEAVADVRDFLPFRRYRPVDTAWVRTTRQTKALLTGPDGLPVEVHLRFRDRVGDKLFVDTLQVDAPVVLPGEAGSGEEGDEARSRARHRTLLSTSFAMDVGETLVVGTSKLSGGEEALVVLLTATP